MSRLRISDGDTLALLARLDDEALARRMLGGFLIEAPVPARRAALIALGERFGRVFCDALIATWPGEGESARERDGSAGHRYRDHDPVSRGTTPPPSSRCRAGVSAETLWHECPDDVSETTATRDRRRDPVARGIDPVRGS